MRKLVVILVVGLLFAGGASAALVESDFGTAADNAVTIGDLDGVTSGGSWQSIDSFPGGVATEFVQNNAGNDSALLWVDGSGAWWNRVALNFDNTQDFSQDELTVSYDMAWSYPSADKELRVQGKDSSGNTVFTLGWDGDVYNTTPAAEVNIMAGGPTATYMIDEANATQVSANYNKSFGTATSPYDPSGMGSFIISMQGTGLTVTLGDSSSASINNLTSSNVASVEFGLRTTTGYNRGMWLDNVEVIPEPASLGLLGLFGLLFWIRRKMMAK